MRRDENARVIPKGMIGRRRLLRKHVQDRARNLPGGKGAKQILLRQVRAARSVNESGAAREFFKGLAAQNAAGLDRQRQQADEDVRAPEKSIERVRPAKHSTSAMDRFERLQPAS